MRVYIAGPIRNQHEWNREAFQLAASVLRGAGHEPVNPLDLDAAAGITWETHRQTVTPTILREAMKRDLPELLTCDAIAMLPGWRDSELARIEHDLACAVGLQAINAMTLDPLAEEPILAEAERIVSGARKKTYGDPKENHQCTARLWMDWIRRRHGVTVRLTSDDVCWLNALQKASRDAHSPHRDNLVDVCGYMRTIEMIRARDRNP